MPAPQVESERLLAGSNHVREVALPTIVPSDAASGEQIYLSLKSAGRWLLLFSCPN